MDKFIESLTNHNLSFTSIFNNLELHFLDLGAANSLDSYLFPLLLLNGDKFFIDGRTEAELLKTLRQNFGSYGIPFKPTSKLRFHTISAFIGETNSTQPFFYNTESPTSSTFYPVIDQRQINYSYYPKSYSVTPVQCRTLHELLPSSLDHLHFAKIDIEGSELTALNSLFNDNRHPYILEVEISLFKRESCISSWDLISLIEKMGYELLDVRKNYSYKRIPKISPNSGKSFLNSIREASVLPSAMGKISIVDCLFIRRDIELSDPPFTLSLAYILAQYRQYNEALWLISSCADSEIIEQFYRWLICHHEIILNLMKNNPAAAYGFHPYFNWLKHC